MMNFMNNNQNPTEVKQETNSLSLARNGIQINTIEDLFRFSKAVSVAGLAPRGLEKPECVLVAIQMGLELGITPMAALQNIGVINGKPKLYGSMPLALVRASGLLEYIKETIDGSGDSRKAVCVTKRKGDPEPKTTAFSVAEAKAAGLWGKNVWATYPDRMLIHRARGFNLDDNFPDVLKGMAAHDGIIVDIPQGNVEYLTDSTTPTIVESIVTPTDVPKPTEPKPVEKPVSFRDGIPYQKLTKGFRNGGWREVEVHWGTKAMPIKGMQLGDIEKDSQSGLFWLINKWEPTAKDGRFAPADVALRSALDAAKEDIEESHSNGVQPDAPQS